MQFSFFLSCYIRLRFFQDFPRCREVLQTFLSRVPNFSMFYQKLVCTLFMCLQNFTAFSTRVASLKQVWRQKLSVRHHLVGYALFGTCDCGNIMRTPRFSQAKFRAPTLPILLHIPHKNPLVHNTFFAFTDCFGLIIFFVKFQMQVVSNNVIQTKLCFWVFALATSSSPL